MRCFYSQTIGEVGDHAELDSRDLKHLFRTLRAKAGDEIAIRQICVFTLGFDHRLVDGAMGGQFIEEIMKNLESVDPQKELAGILR